MEYKKVSIIIPLYNCENYICLCLKSVMSQKYPREYYEVIVVDNNSTDKSVDIVRKFNVTLLSLPEGNISRVRNYGALFASGEILGFVDSDCIIGKDWISNALEILKNNKIAATGSGYFCPRNASWVEKAWLIESKYDYQFTEFIPGGNFIIKSAIFGEIHGFNEELETCEDADLCERLIKKGYKIVSSARVKNVHLKNHKTIYQMFSREIWYGKDMLNSLKNNKFDIVFISTVLFFFLHILTAIALFITNWSLLFFSMISIVLLVVSATTKRVINSHKYAIFLNTALLYYVYFSARSFAMLSNFKTKMWRI